MGSVFVLDALQLVFKHAAFRLNALVQPCSGESDGIFRDVFDDARRNPPHFPYNFSGARALVRVLF